MMKNKCLIVFVGMNLLAFACSSQKTENFGPSRRESNATLSNNITIIDDSRVFQLKAKKLIENYPGIITGFSNNLLHFHNGSSMVFDDGVINKDFEALLDNPDVEDQFYFTYVKGIIRGDPKKNEDPGRIRNEELFKRIYGSSEDEVGRSLVDVVWCPILAGQKIKFSNVNGAARALEHVSEQLDQHPEIRDFVKNIGGTFNWRHISGTQRLSGHSFGIAIDINIEQANYWQWDCKCSAEDASLTYRNRIPQLIVDIFEKNGFIWGGKWYHYDTMHFEYRPELIEGL